MLIGVQTEKRARSIGLNRDSAAAIVHYVLIYIMVALGDSFLYDRILIYLCPAIAAVSLVLLLFNKKSNYLFPLSILPFSALVVLCVRLKTNAVGVSELLVWFSMVCVTLLAVGFNISKFLERLIKLTAALSFFSVLIFFCSQLVPGIWSHFTPFSFLLTFGDDYWLDAMTKLSTSYFQAHGLLLYVDRGFDSARNVGIFREPAVYQVMLNSLIFVLLYMCPDSLKNKRVRLIALFVVTVLTTKSATGYLVCFALFFMYFIHVGVAGKRIDAVYYVLLALGGAFLVSALFLGNSSWIFESVFGRFFGGNGFSLDASGSARTGAASISLKLIHEYPLGCGYDVYTSALNANVTGYVAACLFRVVAIYGIPFGIFVIFWIFYPLFLQPRMPMVAIFSFAFMYLMATFFENEIFYTTLIFIPIYLYCKNVAETSVQPLRAAASSFGVSREAR